MSKNTAIHSLISETASASHVDGPYGLGGGGLSSTSVCNLSIFVAIKSLDLRAGQAWV